MAALSENAAGEAYDTFRSACPEETLAPVQVKGPDARAGFDYETAACDGASALDIEVTEAATEAAGEGAPFEVQLSEALSLYRGNELEEALQKTEGLLDGPRGPVVVFVGFERDRHTGCFGIKRRFEIHTNFRNISNQKRRKSNGRRNI